MKAGPADKRQAYRRRGCEGSALIMVTVAIVALLAFCIVAIDGAILMATKTQLQNAADSAALAGASGLAEGSEVLATQRAITFAGHNRAVQESLSAVVITAEDVTFPTEARIRVVTHRTEATGDPLRTYFLRVVDVLRPNTADVSAVAVAEVSNICATNCVKPWAPPDRWNDLDGDGEYDEGEPYHPEDTGYMPPDDIGVQIVLKIGNPNKSPEPGHFFPVNFPALGGEESPLTGADWYREWIASCSPYQVSPGDSLQLEPGNMTGPTSQGFQELFDQDPDAYWDDDLDTIMGSDWGLSPRVIKVAFYDPTRSPKTGRNYVHVIKIGAFFLESLGPGSQVTARFMQIATQGVPCDDQDSESWLKGYRLVE